MPCNENIVVEIPNINIGIARGRTNKITITLDFFAPSTKADPITPINENDKVPIVKLKHIIPTKLKGRFKNNDIIGNKIIRGNPTEIQ